MHALRLATVPYVNAEPLVWGFRKGPYRAGATLLDVPPAVIPDLLRTGEVDLGLIPSIEYQRVPGLEMLPHLCIASKRRARSVYLASRVPIERVRRVALDRNSRTSVALLKVLLAWRAQGEVEYTEHAPSLKQMLRDNDAALLIGDSALTSETTGLEVMDLAAEWFAATGLPFVFAIWAIRPGAALPDGVRPFLESRRMGLANIASIAREAGVRLGLPAETLEEYLRVNLHYHLASEEARALDLFYRQAHEAGVLSSIPRPVSVHEPLDREPARAGRERP